MESRCPYGDKGSKNIYKICMSFLKKEYNQLLILNLFFFLIQK